MAHVPFRRIVRSGGRARQPKLGRDLAAAGGGPAARLGAGRTPGMAFAGCKTARLGAGRGGRRPAAALGPDCVRDGDRLLLRGRSRAGGVGRRGRGGFALHGGFPAAAAKGVRRRRSRCGRRRGLCQCRVEDRPGCAWRAGAADLLGIPERLRRDPRGARAHRPVRAARGRDGECAAAGATAPGSPLGQERHRARRRRLCRVESATAAAARAAPARQLRFRPRHVFCRHRRLGLCDGLHHKAGGAVQRRMGAALCRFDARLARCHRRADPHRIERRPPRHRYRLADRTTRRHLGARQRRHVHFRARPRAVDFRLPHGGRRRRCVLYGACAARLDPGAYRHLPDQEVVGGGSAARRRVLPAAVRCGSRDPALLFYDRSGFDRGHGRPPRGDFSHPGGGRDGGADDCAGSAGASEFSDVVCGNAWAGGAGPDRHARAVRLARPFGDRARRAVGRPRGRDARTRLAHRRARDHALRRLPLSSHHPLRADRQSRRDAGGLRAGDAGRPAGHGRDAVRVRRPVLAPHGVWHRLDDRRRALGCRAPGRGRPNRGLRHWTGDRGKCWNHPAWPVAHAAALERRRRNRNRGAVGGDNPEAGPPDLCRGKQHRGARPRRAAARRPYRKGRLSAQGVARGRCGRAAAP